MGGEVLYYKGEFFLTRGELCQMGCTVCIESNHIAMIFASS